MEKISKHETELNTLKESLTHYRSGNSYLKEEIAQLEINLTKSERKIEVFKECASEVERWKDKNNEIYEDSNNENENAVGSRESYNFLWTENAGILQAKNRQERIVNDQGEARKLKMTNLEEGNENENRKDTLQQEVAEIYSFFKNVSQYLSNNAELKRQIKKIEGELMKSRASYEKLKVVHKSTTESM